MIGNVIAFVFAVGLYRSFRAYTKAKASGAAKKDAIKAGLVFGFTTFKSFNP